MSSFLQSQEWEAFQKATGMATHRVQNQLVITRPLPFSQNWLYCPRPNVTNQNWQEELVALAKQEKAMFIRSEVELPSWKLAPSEVQPKDTLVLDLTKTEEELLAAMHHKTRYNIQLAAKKGVQIRFSRDPKDLESFLKINREVSGRSDFHYHEDEYYKKMLEVLGQAGMLELAVAEYDQQAIAVHILISHEGTVTYAHGASSSQQRSVMGPHLLQWESIKRAKQNGAKSYDFYGIAPANAENTHPWAGITRFKQGFGGERISYAGAHDLVVKSLWYRLYKMRKR